MITGIIELLTRRRVEGWVYGDHHDEPLQIRVRDGQDVLLQENMPAEQSLRPSANSEKENARSFRIVFGTPLSPTKLAQITVEVARRDSSRWYILPRQMYMPGPEVRPEPPLLVDFGKRSRSLFTVPAPAFWSDDIIPNPSNYLESHPVFVLGAARSGTTVLCLALKTATRYRGFPEGHVLDIACRLAGSVASHFEKKDGWIPLDISAGYHLGRVTHAFFENEALNLLRRLASQYTTPFWFDKTPTYQMVASVPVLAQAWPNARFVFMKRRGLENLCSRLRKFANCNFRLNCHDWSLIMAGWRAVRAAIPVLFIEFDQRMLLQEPYSVAANLW